MLWRPAGDITAWEVGATKIIDEHDLWLLYKISPKKALEALEMVDYVFDRWGWLVPAERYIEKIEGEGR